MEGRKMIGAGFYQLTGMTPDTIFLSHIFLSLAQNGSYLLTGRAALLLSTIRLCGFGHNVALLGLGDETRTHKIIRGVRHAAHVRAVVLPAVITRAILCDGATGRIHHVAGDCSGALVGVIVYAVAIGVRDFLNVAIRAGPARLAIAEVSIYPILTVTMDARVSRALVDVIFTIIAGKPGRARAGVASIAIVCTLATILAWVGIAGIGGFWNVAIRAGPAGIALMDDNVSRVGVFTLVAM